MVILVILYTSVGHIVCWLYRLLVTSSAEGKTNWLAVLSSLEEWRHPHLEARATRDVAILELVSKVAQRTTLLAQAQLELTVRRFHMFLFIPLKELGIFGFYCHGNEVLAHGLNVWRPHCDKWKQRIDHKAKLAGIHSLKVEKNNQTAFESSVWQEEQRVQ